jgi:hypothetical protein
MNLDDREKRKLVGDYLELTKDAQKTNKVTSNVDANFVLPDFQEILNNEQVTKNAIRYLFPDVETTKEGGARQNNRSMAEMV